MILISENIELSKQETNDSSNKKDIKPVSVPQTENATKFQRRRTPSLKLNNVAIH